MEQYYYNHMNKQEQAAYHGILQGLSGLADEFQIPALDGETLYNVFFQLRLDHPEIFWATGYKYRYYKESPNIIFVPEYLFDKGKIKEHQKAMKSRVEKLVRPAKNMSEWEKRNMYMILSVRMYTMTSSKRLILMRSSARSDREWVSARALQRQ